MSEYRADHVGSLLRPPEVLQAHTDFAQGKTSREALRQAEDSAILAALDLQRQVGLDVVSDGEFRRSDWTGEFSQAVDGYVFGPVAVPMQWRLPEQLRSDAAASAVAEAMRTMPHQTRVIGARLHQKRRYTQDESSFLKQHATGPWKITLPAASYIVARGYSPGITDKVYASRAEAAADVARIVHTEVTALAAEGALYIQIDNPHYPDYIPEDRRERLRSIGIDPDQALAQDIATDNTTVQGIDRQRHVVAMHICRGNGRSAWHTEGGYERIAEQVFGSLDIDRFLLEYDSERAGGFEPLRFVPKGKRVVLGLVTTKVGELESRDLLRRRIDEASKYVPMENLSLSPQCGFASMADGNFLTRDDERRKLELVVETARQVWG
jgi:5-methyltetrahydropteroyltriglutamate--homocysteine methyltransferase